MKKILILDDDLVYLRLVCRILTSRGYKVRQASHHVEFFSQLEGEEPQLVMLDINMPEKDGFQVYRELMAQHTIPVLFVTGYPASFN